MTSTIPSLVAMQVPGLDADDQDVLTGLVNRLAAKAARNRLRRSYYDHEAGLRDLGISIPPQLKKVEIAVGWPSKAVDSMSRRTILDRFTSVSGDEALLSVVERVWDDNRMATEVPSAHTSALIHSCAFVFNTQGDVAAGEPRALVTARSAEWATGEWDGRTRSLRSALSVLDVDPLSGAPTEAVLYRPGRTVIMRRLTQDRWDLRLVQHSLGVPVELLPYRVALDRPFGRSRISRSVMYLTDAAVRTMLRTEVGAEFYNAPQRYVLGADEGAFADADGNPTPAWKVMLGRMLTLTRDEEGELPQVGQFAQQTMQPNIEQLRSLAQMFAAETSLPVGSLGIIQDNPSSAEAIRAANEELGVEIEHWRRTSLAPAWERVMRRAVAIETGSSTAAEAARGLRAQWGSWAAPSEVSSADAAVKRVTAIPRLAETDVELERMGYSRDEIGRIQAQWRRQQGSANLTALLARGAQVEAQPAVVEGA